MLRRHAVAGLLRLVARPGRFTCRVFARVQCERVGTQRIDLRGEPILGVCRRRTGQRQCGPGGGKSCQAGVERGCLASARCQLLIAGRDQGGLGRLGAAIVLNLATAHAHLLAQARQNRIELRVLVLVGMLGAAADRAGRTVGQGGAQLGHA